MLKQYKVDEVNVLVAKLQERKNVILTSYSGIKVKDLSVLRKKLREKNVEYKVVKNTLFRIALNQLGVKSLDDHLKGPLGVVFVNNEVGEVAKILKDFGADKEQFSYSYALIDNVVYNKDQVKTIAELPSREVVLSQVMYMINGPTSHIARGLNEIMASLARGIKAVAEKNGK